MSSRDERVWTDVSKVQEVLNICRRTAAVVGAAVCHDLNNPLQGVVGFADLLVQEGAGGGGDDLELILTSAILMRDLLEAVGELASAFPPEVEDLPVEEFSRAVLATWPDSGTQTRALEVHDGVRVVRTDPVFFMFVLRGLSAPPTSGPAELELAVRRGDDALVLDAHWTGEGVTFEPGARGLERGFDVWMARRAARLLGGAFFEEGGAGRIHRQATVPEVVPEEAAASRADSGGSK